MGSVTRRSTVHVAGGRACGGLPKGRRSVGAFKNIRGRTADEDVDSMSWKSATAGPSPEVWRQWDRREERRGSSGRARENG